MGRQRGRDAAAWVFNGTTGTDDCRRGHAAGSQDGGLMVIGAGCKPFPSGGCAGGWAAADLTAAAGICPCGEDPGDADAVYQEAASEAFWDELERLCDGYLADAE
jgi:hypothetical protein